MTGALPLLPSVRAKELERASANNDSDDHVNNAPKPNQIQSLEQSKLPVQSESVSSTTLPSKASLDTPYQSDTTAKRSEQLAVQNQKEQKIFGGLPPLESSVACDTIHHYIATTSSFLNSFIADVNASHDGIDHKLTVLENHMALLESKIASMPDLYPDEDDSRDLNEDVEVEKAKDESEGGEEVKSN